MGLIGKKKALKRAASTPDPSSNASLPRQDDEQQADMEVAPEAASLGNGGGQKHTPSSAVSKHSTCTFFMLSADFVRKFPGKSLPFFQDLRDKFTTDEPLVEVSLDYADVVKGTHIETTLAVSHRWMQPDDPDPDGEQLKALKGFLNSPPGKKIERVWIDSACMPQDHPKGSRSAEDTVAFKRMLKEVNRLYLGTTVLILLDLSYVSRFWTQFESWMSMQFAMPDGLKPAVGTENERHHIVCTQNAGQPLKTALVEMWAAKTPDEAHDILSKPDVTVTNQSDKEAQLPKIKALDATVQGAFGDISRSLADELAASEAAAARAEAKLAAWEAENDAKAGDGNRLKVAARQAASVAAAARETNKEHEQAIAIGVIPAILQKRGAAAVEEPKRLPPPSPPSPPPQPPPAKPSEDDSSVGLIAGIAGAVLLVVTLAGALMCLRRRRPRGAVHAAEAKGVTRAATVRVKPEESRTIQQEMALILKREPRMLEAAQQQIDYAKMNFATPQQLNYVSAADNRRGIVNFMCVDEVVVLRRKLQGLDGLREEVAAFAASAAGQEPGGFHGTAGEELSECLKYVLDEEAGSSSVQFQGGLKRDCDANGQRLPERDRWQDGRVCGGMRLNDFYYDMRVRMSGVKIEHVAALRLYTTAAFRHINDPLRDMNRRKAGKPHPLPFIVSLIEEACKRLGLAVEQLEADANQPKDLFRGMRSVELPRNFLDYGGVEIAPMSTTENLKVAMEYSMSKSSVILRIKTSSFFERGVGVKWLSAFPAEEEILFPPLTHMKATGALKKFTLKELAWTIVTVEPRLP